MRRHPCPGWRVCGTWRRQGRRPELRASRRRLLDVSGTWRLGGNQDAGYGTAAGAFVDCGGIPFSEAGRLFALAWPASPRQTLRTEQCAGYVIPYAFYSPGNYRFWEERDPYTQRLIAIHMYFQTSELNRTIWMDGRPHPPAWAAHTFAGFSTGEWRGNVLQIKTTHLKHGYIRGNGASQSDETTVYEALIRHDDRLTYFAETVDPIWLDGPFTKTVIDMRNNIDPTAWLYACEDGEEIIPSRPDTRIRTSNGASILRCASMRTQIMSRCWVLWAAWRPRNPSFWPD